MGFLGDTHEQCTWTRVECQRHVDEARASFLAATQTPEVPFPAPMYRVEGPFGASRLFPGTCIVDRETGKHAGRPSDSFLRHVGTAATRYEGMREAIESGVGGSEFAKSVDGRMVRAYDSSGTITRGGAYNYRGQLFDASRDGKSKRYGPSPDPTPAGLNSELAALLSALDSVPDGDTVALAAVLGGATFSSVRDRNCAQQLYDTRAACPDFHTYVVFVFA